MGVLGGQLFVFGGYFTERSIERMNADGWEEVEQRLQRDYAYGGSIFTG